MTTQPPPAQMPEEIYVWEHSPHNHGRTGEWHQDKPSDGAGRRTLYVRADLVKERLDGK